MTRPDLSVLHIERQPGARRRASRLRHLSWVLPLAGAAAALVLWRAQAPRTVQTSSVTLAYPYQAHVLLSATGYVVPQRKAAVASKATGRLEWLGVAEGSTVRRGEIIARLESADVAAARGQARANVDVARAGLKQALAESVAAEREAQRTRELLGRGFVSASADDAAVARRDKARAAVGSARAAIAAARAGLLSAEVAVEQTLIRAPFDAVVLTRNANVGDTITPFSAALDTKGAVVTVADMDTLEVEADVSESSLQRVRVGQPCEIELDAVPEVRFTGRVSRLVPTVDRAKATLLAKVAFDRRDLRVLPDMSARVAFLDRPASAADLQPRTMLSVRALAGTSAFVLREGRLHRVTVDLGERSADLVEVRGGLAAGDTVVLDPPADLQEGPALAAERGARP